MTKSEVKEIIRKLKKKEVRVLDIPEEYKNNIEIVTFERKEGLRITEKRGYDVISNSFFIEEKLIYIRQMAKNQVKIFFYHLIVLILILIF